MNIFIDSPTIRQQFFQKELGKEIFMHLTYFHAFDYVWICKNANGCWYVIVQ